MTTDGVTPANDELREEIGSVLGRTPSGVFILTACDGHGNETGMLASWVQQASFDPPMVSVAMNRSRYLNDWFKQTGRFALNLIGEAQTVFLKHFARGFEPDEPAFEGLALARSETGLPMLADALGYIEGSIAGQIAAGDHIIYLLEINSAQTGSELGDRRPMVHIRRNGFRY